MNKRRIRFFEKFLVFNIVMGNILAMAMLATITFCFREHLQLLTGAVAIVLLLLIVKDLASTYCLRKDFNASCDKEAFLSNFTNKKGDK